MADVVQTPHADAGSIPMHRTSQASLVQRVWRAKRYYLYLVPIFALLGVFSYYPPLMALYYSFTNYDGLSGKFIGLENFTDLASDRIFRASIKNAVILLFANMVTGLSSRPCWSPSCCSRCAASAWGTSIARRF